MIFPPKNVQKVCQKLLSINSTFDGSIGHYVILGAELLVVSNVWKDESSGPKAQLRPSATSVARGRLSGGTGTTLLSGSARLTDLFSPFFFFGATF